MHLVRTQDLPFVGSSYNFVGADHDVAMSMFIVEAHPGRGAPLHFHDYDEIIIVQEGHSRLALGDCIRDAMAGDIVVIKAGTPHGFVNVATVPLKQLDIHLNAHFLQHDLEPTDASRRAGLPERSLPLDEPGHQST